MADLGLGSIAGGFQVMMIVLGVIAIMAGVGFGLWYYWRTLQYKIPVTIHKVVGDSKVPIELYDKARKIKKDDKNELHLKKLKEKIFNPSSDYYVKTHRGERLYFRWDGGHVFVPQKVVYNSPLNFEPATYNILAQMAWRIKERAERHKNKGFWDLYGSIIVWTGVIMVSAITLWILFSKLELVAGAINNLASSVSSINAAQVVQ